MAKKFSQFPAAPSVSASDTVVGLQEGQNTRFSFATILAYLRQQIGSFFVPTSREINGKALSSDITLDASDVGAVDASDVGVADGVAGLDSNGKVPSSQLPPISSDAADITYDPTTSGASATNVQNALDEAFDDLDGKQDTITASGILKGDGQSGVSAATAGTDYQTPLTAGTDYATPGMIPAIPSAYTSNPAMDGTASPGSSGAWAKGDHVHPSDTSRVPVYGMGKNLLDNAYFVGGGSQLGAGIFPINQIGKTSYSGSVGPSINRWTKINSTVVLESDGIRLTKTNTEMFRQTKSSAFWKSLLGQVVTLSIWGGDGLVWTTFTMPSTLGNWDTPGLVLNNLNVDIYGNSSVDGSCGVRLFDTASPNSTSWKLYEVRLELGRQQTIAHQENGVWVKNELPNYETELIKCQTNTANSTDTYANKTLATEQQIAHVETGTTVSRAYSVGEYFCWNGLLYRVTAAISNGGLINPGTNCTQQTVMESFAGFHIMRFTGTTPNGTSAYNQATGANSSLSTLIGFSVQNKTNAGWYDVPGFQAILNNGNLRFSIPSDQVSAYGNCPFRAYILTV